MSPSTTVDTSNAVNIPADYDPGKPIHARIHYVTYTYEGQILGPFEEDGDHISSPHHKSTKRGTGRGSGRKNKNKCPTSAISIDINVTNSKTDKTYYIKHGKGTIYDHNGGMTLTGYFQNDQIVGHALQTLYDPIKGRPIAQYEGSFLFSSPSTYIPHGIGKYTWQTSHDVYYGEFHEGELHGEGTFVWGSSGDRYEGPFKKGRIHGKNGKKYCTATGDIFEGCWKKGLAHGWGNKRFGNGDVFNGNYSKDMRQGFGVYIWNNGDVYAGHWENGTMNGRGAKSLVQDKATSAVSQAGEERENADDANADAEAELGARDVPQVTLLQGGYTEIYNGQWKNDLAQGNGMKRYGCGDMYHGSFHNDKRHGYGVYTWFNGDIYEGYFYDGLCCGLGIKRMANGDVYDGEWCGDKANGYGVKTHELTGCIHMGYYKNDERHGHGNYRWINGDEYEGDFADGDQCGFGEYRWADSSVYKGRWSRGRKHGPGFMRVFFHNIERIYFEVWSEGKRIYRHAVFATWEDLPSLHQFRVNHGCLGDLVRNHWIAQI